MPIVNIGDNKQLEFGYGDIKVCPGTLKGSRVGVVTFQQHETPQPIGESVEHTEALELAIEETPVRMIFEKVESIDVVIKTLQEAKQLMLHGNKFDPIHAFIEYGE